MKLTKGLKVIVIVYVVLFLLDLTTTLSLGELTQHLEANPLYALSGSFIPIILLNIAFLLVYIWAYNKGGVGTRYFLVGYFVYQSLIRCYAAYRAISIKMDPPTIAQAQAVTASFKQTQYFLLALSYLLPLIIMMITYWIFKIDHEILKKEGR